MSLINPFSPFLPAPRYPSLFNPMRFYGDLFTLSKQILEQQKALVTALDGLRWGAVPTLGFIISIDVVEIDTRSGNVMKTVAGEVIDTSPLTR